MSIPTHPLLKKYRPYWELMRFHKPIGILLFSSVIPIAAKRFGARAVAITAAMATAMVVIGYKVFDTLEAWFILRLLQGLSRKYGKPLSARFISDGEAKIGEKTDLKNQYLKDVVVRPL